MKRYLIEEIGTASSDEEEEQCADKDSHNISSEDKTDLIETLNHLSLPSQAPTNHTTSIPIKTIGENTQYSNTVEDHNHLTKPASTDEHNTDTPSQHEGTNISQHRPTSSKDSLSRTVPAIPSTDDVTTCDLTPPLSSIQFQSTWKRLEKNPEVLYSYMQVCCLYFLSYLDFEGSKHLPRCF